jgi:hypothetical protein
MTVSAIAYSLNFITFKDHPSELSSIVPINYHLSDTIMLGLLYNKLL